MQKINKIFLTLIISLPFIFGISLADNSDCGIFAIGKYSNTTSDNSFQIIEQVRGKDDYIYSKFLKDAKDKIIDKDSLNTAILNLKKYCCENPEGGLSTKSETCRADHNSFNPNAVDSPYLFIHLFDVIMRRLNGLTGSEDIYTDTKMTVDELGAERRSRINEKAEDLSGSDVQSIIDGYKKYWTYHKEYDITKEMDAQFGNASNENFLKYVIGSGGEESEKISKVFQDYEKRSLYDRYHNACALTEYFYALLNVGIESNDKIKTINILAKGLCENTVKQQISDENKYVGIVTQKAGNRFLYNYLQSYISYLNDRRNTLRDTMKDTNNKRLDIVRGVPQLVKSCVS